VDVDAVEFAEHGPDVVPEPAGRDLGALDNARLAELSGRSRPHAGANSSDRPDSSDQLVQPGARAPAGVAAAGEDEAGVGGRERDEWGGRRGTGDSQAEEESDANCHSSSGDDEGDPVTPMLKMALERLRAA
jgi:hypothetical protein